VTGGFAVQQGATVVCTHTTGRAQPMVTSARVTLSGSAAVGLTALWAIPDCTNPVASGGPCKTATWTAGSSRVRSMGERLVIQGGAATCLPTGATLTVKTVQGRVTFA
jgi:hypothetical protein